MKRKRDIRPEERALWHHVARQAKPLPGKVLPVIEPQPVAHPPALPAVPLPMPEAKQAHKRAIPPLVGVEKPMLKKLARGTHAPERTIDLHGMRQAEAHRALLDFVHQAHHAGVKLALVITGKGGDPAQPGERGVLRRHVPHWLADPGLRRYVIGYEVARPQHGGDGALYLRLRRARPAPHA